MAGAGKANKIAHLWKTFGIATLAAYVTGAIITGIVLITGMLLTIPLAIAVGLGSALSMLTVWAINNWRIQRRNNLLLREKISNLEGNLEVGKDVIGEICKGANKKFDYQEKEHAKVLQDREEHSQLAHGRESKEEREQIQKLNFYRKTNDNIFRQLGRNFNSSNGKTIYQQIAECPDIDDLQELLTIIIAMAEAIEKPRLQDPALIGKYANTFARLHLLYHEIGLYMSKDAGTQAAFNEIYQQHQQVIARLFNRTSDDLQQGVPQIELGIQKGIEFRTQYYLTMQTQQKSIFAGLLTSIKIFISNVFATNNANATTDNQPANDKKESPLPNVSLSLLANTIDTNNEVTSDIAKDAEASSYSKIAALNTPSKPTAGKGKGKGKVAANKVPNNLSGHRLYTSENFVETFNNNKVKNSFIETFQNACPKPKFNKGTVTLTNQSHDNIVNQNEVMTSLYNKAKRSNLEQQFNDFKQGVHMAAIEQFTKNLTEVANISGQNYQFEDREIEKQLRDYTEFLQAPLMEEVKTTTVIFWTTTKLQAKKEYEKLISCLDQALNNIKSAPKSAPKKRSQQSAPTVPTVPTFG